MGFSKKIEKWNRKLIFSIIKLIKILPAWLCQATY